jgi:hypothetical protein
MSILPVSVWPAERLGRSLVPASRTLRRTLGTERRRRTELRATPGGRCPGAAFSLNGGALAQRLRHSDVWMGPVGGESERSLGQLPIGLPSDVRRLAGIAPARAISRGGAPPPDLPRPRTPRTAGDSSHLQWCAMRILAAKAPASRREAPRHLRLRGHRICDLAVRIVGRARRRKPEPADTALARPSIRTQPRRKETDRSDPPHPASWAGSGMAGLALRPR